MAKFIIQPHFRLQEWVAEELGFFKQEGLDYEFREQVRASGGAIHDTGDKVGAYQSIEEGRESTVSCACHWTVNVAASAGHTKIYADAYSIAPSGIFVPPKSKLKSPEDLAGVPISVGFQSGSHYSTIQALERYFDADDINLSFHDGMLFNRMELLIDGKAPAASLFSGPYYFAEQLGFRKIADTTFMIAANVKPDTDPDDVRKYYAGLKKAQIEIDLRPEIYTHYYQNEFPERFHARMDTRRWGPGERIVFESYSKETFDRSFDWIAEHEIFAEGDMGQGDYEKAIFTLSA
jgi:ABC-type nitrate/sulfonate/bicarbonate transport system substrate-binding protein